LRPHPLVGWLSVNKQLKSVTSSFENIYLVIYMADPPPLYTTSAVDVLFRGASSSSSSSSSLDESSSLEDDSSDPLPGELSTSFSDVTDAPTESEPSDSESCVGPVRPGIRRLFCGINGPTCMPPPGGEGGLHIVPGTCALRWVSCSPKVHPPCCSSSVPGWRLSPSHSELADEGRFLHLLCVPLAYGYRLHHVSRSFG
jgi:hypothetical protein